MEGRTDIHTDRQTGRDSVSGGGRRGTSEAAGRAAALNTNEPRCSLSLPPSLSLHLRPVRSDGGRGGEGVGVVGREGGRREEGGEGEQEIEEEEEGGREEEEEALERAAGGGRAADEGGTRLQRGRRNSGNNKIEGEKYIIKVKLGQ